MSDNKFDGKNPQAFTPKRGLKTQGTSMFDKLPKKPSQQEFKERVNEVQEKSSDYKQKAAELNAQFYKAMTDKTLLQNQNVFHENIEKQLMQQMLNLANEINNDGEEAESVGTLMIVVPLLKNAFNQRNRINDLEYANSKLFDELNNIKKRLDELKKDD